MLKITSPLLRALSFSACLFASTATAGHAATITATGTVPGTCSVTGANVPMALTTPYKLYAESADGTASSTGPSGATFYLSTVTITESPSTAPNLNAGIFINLQLNDGTITPAAMAVDLTNARSMSFDIPFSGRFIIGANVISTDSTKPLTSGNYAIAATLTCLAK